MAEFIKVGNEITVKPKLEGLAYELIKGSVFVRYMAEDKGVKNIDEVVLFEDIPLTQIAKDMNISTEKIKEENKVSTQDDTQSSDMDEVCIEIMENKILNPL